MTNMIHSYPTVYALGHKAIDGIFSDPVQVEEKIDGSQISFCKTLDGELLMRSKNAPIVIDAPEGMFAQAAMYIRSIEHLLHPGWVYRGEYLQKPKHNVLAYDRTPSHNIIGFDVLVGEESYLTYDEKWEAFSGIFLECVPLLYSGTLSDVAKLQELLETQSILGGQKVEGVVVKNYARFTVDKKIMIGKFVSEKFKEIAGGEWKRENPTGADILFTLVGRYRTPARWQKAVQHLREREELEGSPRDIGKLIIEARADLRKECEQEIKDILFAHYWPKIERASIAGLPEWYKESLLESAFSPDGET